VRYAVLACGEWMEFKEIVFDSAIHSVQQREDSRHSWAAEMYLMDGRSRLSKRTIPDTRGGRIPFSESRPFERWNIRGRRTQKLHAVVETGVKYAIGETATMIMHVLFQRSASEASRWSPILISPISPKINSARKLAAELLPQTK